MSSNSLSRESVALIAGGVAAALLGVAIAIKRDNTFVAHAAGAPAGETIGLPKLPMAVELPAVPSLPKLPRMRRTPPLEDFLEDASDDITSAVNGVKP